MDANTRQTATDLLGSSVYLKPNTKLEPLICQWPAWPHLLGPAAYAMNLAYRHLPTLDSFLKNPAVHEQANKNPAMLGGPFVCLTKQDEAAVRTLLAQTKERCQKLLAFARDYRDLNEKLQLQAKGTSLDAFHRSMPESLAGVLELVYDLNNHPKIRIMEELLYSKMPELLELQELCMHDTADVERSFFMSTPILRGPGKVFLKARFDDERLQALSAMRIRPRRLADAVADFGIDEREVDSLARLCTTQSPQRNSPSYVESDIRVRYFGHACVLLQSRGVSILIDPWTAWERDSEQATLTFADLPDFIDHVVITHAHADHFVAETLLQLRGRIGSIIVPRNDPGNLADPSLKGILKHLGFSNVVQVDAFDSVPLPLGGELLSLPFTGEHAGLDVTSKHCVAIRLQSRTFLFLVDSDGVESALYRYLAPKLGKVDALFIGMECHGAPLSWLYGPLFTRAISRRDDESRRLNASDCERACGIMQHLECSGVFIYAMGQEPWLRRIMGLSYQPDSVQLTESERFLNLCREKGMTAQRLSGCTEMHF